MQYKINNTMGGSIPLGSFGSFDLSQGSEDYIHNLGTSIIPGFILDIFGTKPAPTAAPQINPMILYTVGGGALLLVVVLMMKKKPRGVSNYRSAPRKYKKRK